MFKMYKALYFKLALKFVFSLLTFFLKAIEGVGIDRHLMGLKLTAIENGMDVPDFYRDPGYSTSNNWRCSTSQVSWNLECQLIGN